MLHLLSDNGQPVGQNLTANTADLFNHGCLLDAPKSVSYEDVTILT
jgi:hypothetical protein